MAWSGTDRSPAPVREKRERESESGGQLSDVGGRTTAQRSDRHRSDVTTRHQTLIGMAVYPTSAIRPPTSRWYAIAFNFATRMAIGGWVPSNSAKNPSRFVRARPSGSAMHRCALPRLSRRRRGRVLDLLQRARQAAGFRVNCALMASARYSRLRLTPSASKRVTNGAMSQLRTHRTSTTMRSGLSRFPRGRPSPDPHAQAAAPHVAVPCHPT